MKTKADPRKRKKENEYKEEKRQENEEHN